MLPSCCLCPVGSIPQHLSTLSAICNSELMNRIGSTMTHCLAAQLNHNAATLEKHLDLSSPAEGVT